MINTVSDNLNCPFFVCLVFRGATRALQLRTARDLSRLIIFETVRTSCFWTRALGVQEIDVNGLSARPVAVRKFRVRRTDVL